MPRSDAEGLQLLEVGGDRGAFLDRCVRHHADQPPVGIGQLLHPGSLVDVLARIDPDLGEHDLVDLDLRPATVEVAEIVALVDLRHALQPGVAEMARVVEVDVAVDDRKARHVASLVARGTARAREV